MLNKDDLEKEKRAERRMRYPFNATQIDTIKRHQWDMTHYALLVFAGITGITTLLYNNLFEKKEIYEQYRLPLAITLIVISTYILIFIFRMLILYQRNLVFNRRESIRIEKEFETVSDIRRENIPPRYFNYWYQGEILFTFKLSIVIGYSFSVWYIIFKLLIN